MIQAITTTMSKIPPIVPPTMAPMGGGDDALDTGAAASVLVAVAAVCEFVATVRPLAVGATKLDPVKGGRDMILKGCDFNKMTSTMSITEFTHVIESILNNDGSLGLFEAFIKVALCCPL